MSTSLVLWGARSSEQLRREFPTYPKLLGELGEGRDFVARSGSSSPLSEVDLPASCRLILWDCSLLIPPFRVNCPRHATTLNQNGQGALYFPWKEVASGQDFCSGSSPRQCDCLHGLAIGSVLIASEWLVYLVSFGFLPPQTVRKIKLKPP